MKKELVIGLLVCIFSIIIYLFWQNEWKYSLQTPIPKNHRTVNTGAFIQLDTTLFSDGSKPTFIHFYNPACPCSRFNIPEFTSLVKKYDSKINFAVVVLNKKKNYLTSEIQAKFKLSIPVLFDESIASRCGVYSTPQAVLIKSNGTLYYRGNYNKSRYCTDKKTEFAKMAIDSLLSNSIETVSNPFALQAYGCELPNCTKQ